MRNDERMSSRLDYIRDSGSERSAGTMEQPLLYRSRSGEEARPRGGSSHDALSPTALGSSGASNGHASSEANAGRRESAPVSSSQAFFAPPSTPSPQYGFRRNTANAMTAGRRLPHRSASAPGIGSDVRDADPGGQSTGADADQLLSPRLSGSSLQNNEGTYSGVSTRSPKDARRGGGGGIDGGLTSSTAPGTLPSSNGHMFKYNSSLRKYGADRIFQMDDDEVAAALLGEAPSAGVEVDRRTGYRYPAVGAKARSGSAPAVTPSGSSPPPQLVSPNPARLDAEVPAAAPEVSSRAAAAEPKARRERKSGKEEKKRRHHSSRRSRTTSSGGSRAATSASPAQPMASTSSAWFAGMTAAQESRFESLQERSTAGHELARWKMLELMRHWMSAQGTRSSVDAVIRDVLVDAGLAKVKEAWGGGGDAVAPGSRPAASSAPAGKGAGAAAAAMAEAAPAAAALPEVNSGIPASPPSTEVPRDKISPKNQLIAKTAMPSPADNVGSAVDAANAPALPVEAPEVNPSADEAEAMLPNTHGEAPPTFPARETDKESSLQAAPTAESSAGDAESSSKTSQASLSPHQPHHHQHKKDKKAATAAKEDDLPMPPTATNVPAEEDSGGGAGELPDALATPEKQVAPDADEHNGVSPETAAALLRTDAPNEQVSTARPLSEATTPRRTPSEGPLRSRKTSDSALRRSRSSNASVDEAAGGRAATYDEIPRFYFPLGRPTTREQIINGPLSKKHENPHLKVVDGVAIAAAMYDGEENGHLGANAEALVKAGGEDSEAPAEARRGPKVAPMSNLHVVEDKQVAHYIQREFGRLPPYPKHSSKVRLLGGRVRGSNHNSNLPYAKQELLYKQQYVQCVQRICSQCFGVPRYFAFIILRLIQQEVNNGAADTSTEGGRPPTRQAMGSRMGSSSSLLSHTTNGSSGAGSGALASLFHITPQHIKDFYDVHLKSKDSVRRVFDLLILSSRLPNSPVAATSHAVTNAAAAATAAADAQMDDAAPRSLDSAPLRPYLLPQDFVAYIDVLLSQHPGLAFLRQTPDFQTKYLDTVIYRIFYELDRFDRGCIRYSELAASRLIDAFRQVDVAEDINSVLLFFSYEHFYVLYCRFWELDEDRDMLLAPEDLMRYAPEDVMNPAIVRRVFAGVGRRLRCTVPQRIGYEDFVWFCLSEEDKSTPQAIRYWFRVLDLDGDGVLSVYELREFYDATRDKIAQYVQEGLVTFEDVACQVFDMMRCPEYRGLYLSDLMREPEAAAVALNMLTNVVKFLQFEQRDPFVAHQERLLGGLEQSAWDRFARLEYDRMALETDEES